MLTIRFHVVRRQFIDKGVFSYLFFNSTLALENFKEFVRVCVFSGFPDSFSILKIQIKWRHRIDFGHLELH